MVVSRTFSIRGMFRSALAVASAAILASAVAACSGDGSRSGTEDFTYFLHQPLASTNAASALGVATDAAKISARLYPGAFLPGPGTRLLPNSDLLTATPAPDDPQAVDYVISDAATYSDGAPVVCDDFLLTWLAAEHPDFFASDLGLMSRVGGIDCGTGQKAFRVHFDDAMASRYRELFGAGEVLPSHTVAQRAGIENIVDVAFSNDDEALAAVGEAWNTTFSLAVTDPATIPTYGPFRIESRAEDGSLLLSENPEWKGDRPGIGRILLRSGDGLQAAVNGDADLVDAQITKGQPADADVEGAGFTLSRPSGSRIDVLRLATSGVFDRTEARRAFASCVDRATVVDAVKNSTGAEVEPAPFRVATPGTPPASALDDIAVRNNSRDPQVTASVMGGATIRIGFFAEQPRYSAMVDALAASCKDSGVTVVGVPLDQAGVANRELLGTTYDALLETRTAYAHNPEVDISPVSVGVSVSKLREAENVLADMVHVIPLSVEPRLIAVASSAGDISDSGTDGGVSWNMDCWTSTTHRAASGPDSKESN